MLEQLFQLKRRAEEYKRTTPKEHDYRRNSWGHNIEGLTRKGNTEQYTACGFGENVRVGDTLLLKMASGKDARWVFKEVEYFHDPSDMFEMTIEPVEYLPSERN